MKKSLVLAMAMALGVTASAYAANPFSDVPAGHWAYDSVSKLAAAGIVQGYGDTTFGGDKLMTRYEMAEIVAKALAKGANVDKLAAEFADELEALGVRVAKLEKKADNVKITGAMKAQARSYHRAAAATTNNFSRIRTDITIKGAINEDWTYTGLIRNQQRLDDGNKNTNEGTADFQRAYVNGKIGGLKVQAGRYNWTSIGGGDILDDRVDGVQVEYGKKIKLAGGYVQMANELPWMTDKNHSNYLYWADASAKLGKAANAHVGFVKVPILDDEIINAGIALNLGKSMKLVGEYYHADIDGLGASKDGYTAAIQYKGAKAAKPGSYGLMAKYYDMPVAAVIAPGLTYDTNINKADGLKGIQLRAEYTFAKNIVGKVAYYDLEGQYGTKDVNQETLMTEVVFTF